MSRRYRPGVTEGTATGCQLDEDEFIDRIKAEGKAEVLLQVLAARGLDVPVSLRERVLTCTDLGQLEAWADKAATANSLHDVFPD